MAITQVLFYFMSDSSLTSCPPPADIYFVPLHLIWLTSYVLLDFYQRLSYIPSISSVLTSLFSVVHTDHLFYALLFCLDIRTYEHAYQSCSTHLDLLVSCFQAAFGGLHLPCIWFYCILFLKSNFLRVLHPT